jgi:hypothetical protein
MSSKSRITPVISTPIKLSITSLEDGGKGNPADHFPVTKLVNLAIQIQAREVAKYRKKAPKTHIYQANICLFLRFLGIIGFLVTFIGCIVLRNYLNVPECGYDENDCCLSNRNTTFCENCACHLGKCSD